MNSNTQQHQSIRAYQLGQTASEDSARIEERLLIDDEFYQELLIVEDELVDQYLAGRLTGSEKESFETYFLATPERRETLRFARNLKRYVNNEAGQKSGESNTDFASESGTFAAPALPQKRFWPWSNPVVSYSLTAAVVLVVTLTTVLIVRNLNSPPAGIGKVLVVELAPGLSRGDQGTKQIIVPADTANVQLQLRVSNVAAYQTYRAILQTPDGRQISSQDGLRPDPAWNDRIFCLVPANLLTPSDYSLKLSGINQQGEYEDVARYYFRVSNR